MGQMNFSSLFLILCKKKKEKKGAFCFYFLQDLLVAYLLSPLNNQYPSEDAHFLLPPVLSSSVVRLSNIHYYYKMMDITYNSRNLLFSVSQHKSYISLHDINYMKICVVNQYNRSSIGEIS